MQSSSSASFRCNFNGRIVELLRTRATVLTICTMQLSIIAITSKQLYVSPIRRMIIRFFAYVVFVLVNGERPDGLTSHTSIALKFSQKT
jgi:hypothetical protein